ncbi:GNAT family N-acetyltransferase [Rhodopirellula halodulae]|uniref:GNAT family N-acetyltransferase n=1 Tax=Rhodopirellula halodulae TaxID=2894198 RepID=UPI001E644C4C|nr:GNAT family N-acetyltransferase [Rhodopirellula sp. JC737]MCC9656175.1 GNAT family N-acetyltransferase [Rhodopirellula sp. JC737]
MSGHLNSQSSPAVQYQIREWSGKDASACWQLFHDTVHRVNIRDYDERAVNAWAPRQTDLTQWTDRFRGNIALVAEWSSPDATPATATNSIVGFVDLRPDGYLDRLFVSADHQRVGIARSLWIEMRRRAAAAGCTRIETEASITAKPFFESQGFQCVATQTVCCRGVDLTNYRMRYQMPLDLLSGLP